MAKFDKAFGDAVGPLGFPMASVAAKELDGIIKGLPTEVKNLGIKHLAPSIVKQPEIDDGEHSDVSFVTTNALDRDSEVVLAAGGDWKQFKKNPVVTFAHDYTALPIGKAVWWKKDVKNGNEGWLAKTIYAAKPKGWGSDWFPDAVWAMVSEKLLPGKSIGFIPLNYRAPEEKEIKANPSYAKARGVIDKWLVLEYAVTPVQSNPDALVQSVGKMKAKGISIDEVLKHAGIEMPEYGDDVSFDDSRIDPATELERKMAGKYTVYTPPSPVDIEREFRKRASEIINKLTADMIMERVLSRLTGKV